MKIAVLPVFFADSPAQHLYARQFCVLVFEEVRAFFAEQAGGQFGIESRVFNWAGLTTTRNEWLSWGPSAGSHVVPHVQELLGITLSEFEFIVFLVDDGQTTDWTFSAERRFLYFGAKSLNPSSMCRAFGQLRGAAVANSSLDGKSLCVMGPPPKYSFSKAVLDQGDGVWDRTLCGPGMSAPSLAWCGFLDYSRNAIRLKAADSGDPFRDNLHLKALRGAPRDSQTCCAVMPSIERHDELITVEYRRRDGADSELPGNLVLIHRTSVPGSGAIARCELIGHMPALQNQTFSIASAGYSLRIQCAGAEEIQIFCGVGTVQVPAWTSARDILEGNDRTATGGGDEILSAEAARLRVDYEYLQNQPGYGHEEVISINPAPGTSVAMFSTVTVVINLEG